MTEDSIIEERVRQTLRRVAARPIPSSPPAFDPRRRPARHSFRPVGIVLILAAIIGAVIVGLVYGPHSGGGNNQTLRVSAPAVRVMDPANFILMTDAGALEVHSASTGKLVKDLGNIAGETNSGLALSPDGRYVYLTANDSASIEIEQIRVASGEVTIAEGVEPSLSPNGRFLAFGAGSLDQELVICDLKSGSERPIDLQGKLGIQATLLNASLTWLGNGSQIAIIPGLVADAGVGSATTTTTPPLLGSCSAVSASKTCLVIVGVKAGHPLGSKRVIVRGLGYSEFVAGPSGPSGLVVAGFVRSNDVYRVNVAHGSASVNRLFSLSSAFPVAFDRSGAKFFYLKDRGLWLGEVTQHGIENAKELDSNVPLGSLAW